MKYLLLIASLLSISTCGKQTAKNLTPNILLIVIDDLGYADFSPFENHASDISTPNMKRIADGGTIYSQAYVTAPVCSPSRAALITGKNQFRWDIPASWGPGLPDDVKTIAEYLQEAGYETARIGKNDLGQKFHRHDVREYPLNHGYDEFLGFSAHAHDYWHHSQDMQDRTPDPFNTSALLGPLMHNEGHKSIEEGYLTDILTDESIDYIERPREKPFFLTLAYSAVHHLIHQVPKEYLDQHGATEIANYDPDTERPFGRFDAGTYSAYYDRYSRVGDIKSHELRNYYLANLHNLDDNIGRLLDALESEGLDGNTMIIFVSDNGGSPLTGSNNMPLTGGKYSLWEGGIRVPMAVKWPGQYEAGAVEDKVTSALDIFPTIIEATGIDTEKEVLDGISLKSLVDDRMLVWKWQKTWAIRKGDWKLTNANENHWKSDPSDQYIAPIKDDLSLKLFNIAEDEEERLDLSSKHPELVKELEADYQKWIEENVGK